MISYEVGWYYNGTQSNLLRSTFSFAGFLLRDQPNYVTKQPYPTELFNMPFISEIYSYSNINN